MWFPLSWNTPVIQCVTEFVTVLWIWMCWSGACFFMCSRDVLMAGLLCHCSLQSHFNGMQFLTTGFSSLSRLCRHSRDSPMQPSTSISLCSSSSLTVPNFTAWLLSSRWVAKRQKERSWIILWGRTRGFCFYTVPCAPSHPDPWWDNESLNTLFRVNTNSQSTGSLKQRLIYFFGYRAGEDKIWHHHQGTCTSEAYYYPLRLL